MIGKCETKDIFAIGLNGMLPTPYSEAYVLVYAPLADSALILHRDQWEAVRQSIDRSESLTGELQDVVDTLTHEDHAKLQDSSIHSINDFQNLSILPNNKCNFTCSFCYSARGRSNDELSFNKAKLAIDKFIRKDSPARLSLSILGGGEPLLSWPLVKECVEYSEQKAKQFGLTLNISITTNGSLVTDEVIEYFKAHHITTVVSYEVLEDIQDMHRGHYKRVKDSITRMFQLGYTPQFNTVITPDNVNRISEVLETVHRDFPGLKYLCTDPVISPDIFHSVTQLRAFHDNFISSFFEARELGRTYGIKVDCTANISMNCTLDRYCPGEMGVTATGLITSCPCVSSEKEKGFDSYVYGKVSETDIEFDMTRLDEILNRNLYSTPRCKDCPMKYNCGGGCMHKNNIFSPAYISETCRFTNEFGRQYLFRQINSSYMEMYGSGIKELIENE